MSAPPIYLDNNATTRVDPRVVAKMLPYFSQVYGNPASRNHSFGWQADEAVEAARAQVAQLIGAAPNEIVFTSGATESNNLALKGAARMHRTRGNHIITVATEHKAILDPCRRLQREGFEVTYLPVDSTGLVDPDQFAAALTDQTILVSVMVANNEIGTIGPVEAIGRSCKERGVLLHTDATQAVGKIPVAVEQLSVDLLSLSAHKFYGPKGGGALYVRRKGPRVRIDPLIDGGGHERGMRSGTLAVPNIVGLGEACAIAQVEMADDARRIAALRDRLHQGIVRRLTDVTLNGHPTLRLPGTLNLSFAYVEGEALMMAMKEIAVSSGSACSSASLEPSYVLKAIGLSDDLAHSSLRFSLGRFNTEAEIDRAIDLVAAAVARLREISPAYQMAMAQL